MPSTMSAEKHESNISTPSATWEWRRVKIARPAAGQAAQVPKGRRWRHLPPWKRREKLTVTVRYRGGSQAWYEVRARGSMGRFPGDRALDDVMSEVYNDGR